MAAKDSKLAQWATVLKLFFALHSEKIAFICELVNYYIKLTKKKGFFKNNWTTLKI